MQNLPFRIGTVELEQSWSEFTQMYVEHSLQPPPLNKGTMLFLLTVFSRSCWIYSMQKRDQTFLRFCEFKTMAEKEFGKKIKALRSDNGGEFVSQQFKDFCITKGIKRVLTTPHNPQQNGVAERKNRLIVGEFHPSLKNKRTF